MGAAAACKEPAQAVPALLSLGSNLGDRKRFLSQAVEALACLPKSRLTAVSSLYESDPVGLTDQPLFLNCVVRLETRLSALALLHHCQELETRAGRKRTVRWGPRFLDIDLLTVGVVSCQTPELTLPHPRMHERAFVLIPLAEIQEGKKLADSGVRLVAQNWLQASQQGTCQQAKSCQSRTKTLQ